MVLKLYGLYFDLKQADCIGQVTTEAQCFTVSKTVLTSAFEKLSCCGIARTLHSAVRLQVIRTLAHQILNLHIKKHAIL